MDASDLPPLDAAILPAGIPVPALFEQEYLQQNGFAMILLRLKPILEESAEERRLDEGWRYRFHLGRR